MHSLPLSIVPDLDFSEGVPVPEALGLSSETQAIHSRAMRAAEFFRKSESELIDALIEVDHAKVFRKLGHASLFVYATGALGLSEAVAYNAIAVARKAAQVPALLENIRTGEIGIAKARKILPVLNLENQVVWIEKASTLPSRKLEQEVARENPKAATPERATYVSAKRLNLTLGIDEDLMLDLRRAQDQVSRSKGRPANLEETLREVLSFYLPRKDPVERAKRIVAKKGVAPKGTAPVTGQVPSPALSPVTGQAPSPALSPVTGQVPPPALSPVTGQVPPPALSPVTQPIPFLVSRTPIPAAVTHAVRFRDGGRCQFRKPDAMDEICGARRWVDFHHVLPLSEGGTHTLENLVTLCRSHHQAIHERLGK
jgi:hypothetical protein